MHLQFVLLLVQPSPVAAWTTASAALYRPRYSSRMRIATQPRQPASLNGSATKKPAKAKSGSGQADLARGRQPTATAIQSPSSGTPPAPLRTNPAVGYNAAAKLALLRRGKRASHDELLLDFSGLPTRVELRSAGKLLLQGQWNWQSTSSGRALTPQGEWHEVGWHQEKSCDFLEIELPLSHGFKLERQVFFARNELILFLADCLIGPTDVTTSEIHHHQSFSLASNATFAAAAETREGWLCADGRRQATVVPLAQTEWRSDFCHADLVAKGEQLTVDQAVHGHALCSPIWIDLNPRRLRRPLTWRRLTVGEGLTSISRDRAVGYRVQVGDEQWLVYRSLAPVANRSVMGHNTFGSFLCGTVKPDGSIKEILTME